MKKVSVHLVTYNGEKYLPFCLKSLQEQTFEDFSVLIIDNASSDESAKLIDNYLADPTYTKLAAVSKFIKNSKNFGFAGAHNQAIQWTGSEYVFLMNQDVILDARYIKSLVQFLDEQPEVAAVSGTIYQWDFNKSTSAANLGKTDRLDTLGFKIFPTHKVIELTNRSLTASSKPEKSLKLTRPQEVFGVSGALPIYRRRALEKTKIPLFYPSFKLYINQTKPKLYEYFDNDFFSYKEDVDLAYRLRLFGYQAYLVPTARAWHNRSAQAKRSIIRTRQNKSDFVNYHSYKNHLYFLLKNVPLQIWQRHFYQIIPYEIGKLIYLILLEAKTLSALKEFLGHFSKMIKKRVYIQKKIGREAWQNVEKWLDR